MAKMDGTQNFGEKMRLAREAKKLAQSADVSDSIAPIETPSDVPVETAEAGNIEQIKQAPKQLDLKALLDRMEKQDAEIAALKSGKEEDKLIKKEKYKGPWNYKFSLRGGIPVISWKSVRKDPTRDFVYKNEMGIYMSNHYLDLLLANGETVNVEVNTFNRDKQKTEPLPCTVSTDETGETVYIFNTPDYGKISILSSYIN